MTFFVTVDIPLIPLALVWAYVFLCSETTVSFLLSDPLFGGSFFSDYVVYMFIVLYRPLCSTSACCIASCSCSGVRVFC